MVTCQSMPYSAEHTVLAIVKLSHQPEIPHTTKLTEFSAPVKLQQRRSCALKGQTLRSELLNRHGQFSLAASLLKYAHQTWMLLK